MKLAFAAACLAAALILATRVYAAPTPALSPAPNPVIVQTVL